MSQPTCIEEAPSGTFICDFNKTLSSQNHLLPAVTDNSVRYGSLSCSHTNMFLRCVNASTKTTVTTLAVEGRLSLDLLKTADPKFAEAVTGGLTWTVLNHKVRSRFPSFLNLVQSARNVLQHVGRIEHEVQVMMRIHKEASDYQFRGKNPDWDAITEAVTRSRPPCADDVPHLIAFVAALAGGARAPKFLNELVEFHRKTVSDQKIGGLFFKSLADSLVSAPYVALAVCKAQYGCPPEKINKHRECVWITTSDLCTLSQAGQTLEDADAALAYLHKELTKVIMNATDATAKDVHEIRIVCLAKLDQLVVRFLMKKQEVSSIAFQHVDEVIRFVLSEVVVNLPCTKDEIDVVSAKYDQGAAAVMPVGNNAKDVPVLRLAEHRDGKVDSIVRLRLMGLEIGSVVLAHTKVGDIEAANAGPMTIKRTTPTKVVMESLDPSVEGNVHVCSDVFVLSFKKHTGILPRFPNKDFPALAPHNCQSFQVAHAKALIQMAIARVSASQILTNLEVLDRPNRCLRASAAIDKETVVLVPETTNILVKEKPFGSKPPSAAHVEVKFDCNNPLGDAAGDFKFFITPTFSDKFLSPMGAMATTGDPTLANMRWGVMVFHSVGVLSPLGSSPSSSEAPPDLVAGTDAMISVPVLINSKNLKAGDHLVYFKRDERKKDVAIAASSLVPKKKKLKLA